MEMRLRRAGALKDKPSEAMIINAERNLQMG